MWYGSHTLWGSTEDSRRATEKHARAIPLSQRPVRFPLDRRAGATYIGRMKTETQTKHTHPVVFGRREAGCPRCDELRAGAPVRRWVGTSRKEDERRFARDLAAHDCKASRCAVVCTFGDW